MKQLDIRIMLVLLLALLLTLPAVVTALDSGAAATPDHIVLTWSGDPATTITVTWRTDDTVKSGMVQYQRDEAFAAAAQQVKAEGRDFITDLGASRLFSATLAGLDPNSQYSYRVGDGENWSSRLSFKTPDPQAHAFKFLIFGDSQSPARGDSPYAEWRDTVHRAYEAYPDARFMVNVGDLVDLGQSGAHWNAWFAASEGVIDRIPIMPTTGNHESYGSRNTMRPQYYVEQFVLPQNGPEGLKTQVYSYDYGPIHIVVLDSQQEEQKQYGDILTVQQSWLDSDLAATKAPWKIVFLHKPLYAIKDGRSDTEIRQAFSPILERHHVDLVFSGHDHAFARTHILRDGVPVERPSQGTVYYITGRSGAKFYEDVRKSEAYAFLYIPEQQPNYLVLEATDTRIDVKTLNQDGTNIDSFYIDKTSDTASNMPAKTQASGNSDE
jgi:hypothetical protein